MTWLQIKRDMLGMCRHPVFEPMIYCSKYDCKVELYHYYPYVNITCDPQNVDKHKTNPEQVLN